MYKLILAIVIRSYRVPHHRSQGFLPSHTDWAIFYARPI